MKKYSRLTFQERIEIEKLLALNLSCPAIALRLGRHKTSIYREIKKYRKKTYQSYEANRESYLRGINRKYGKSKILLNPELQKYIHEKLYKFWSPDQISVSLKHLFPNNKSMQASHETIYLYIYLHSKKELKNMLISELRQKRKNRGNTRRGTDKRTTIKDPIRIDERPEEVIGREIPGHWEGDLILGKNRESAIGTLVERSSRAVILVHLKSRDAKTVRKAFEKAFSNIPKHLKLSLTYDNGTEMAQHKLFTKNSKVKVYFAHPYSPWERPTNENTNGLIRDYFPKGTDFNLLSKKDILEVQNQLNERPRKTLEYESPLNTISRLYMTQNFI